MENRLELKKKIEKCKRAVILSHRSPDGDSVGSSLALWHYLQHLIPKVTVIIPDSAPQFLEWMDGFEQIINFDWKVEQGEKAIKNADLICCVDFNKPTRMGAMLSSFQLNESAYVLNIDHHQDPDDFADFQISDPSASSTCQLIYDFIVDFGGKETITKSIAECIYCGMVTDTGSFRFSNTSAHTHHIVSELIKKGIVPEQIHRAIYDNYSVDRLKLLGFALNDRFTIYPKYATGIISLTEKDLQRFHFQKGDTEGLVNFPLSVGKIKMAILITEKDGKVKMSFRSKGEFQVNEVASRYFNGGGHHNAAGGTSDLNVTDTLKKIESILPEYETALSC